MKQRRLRWIFLCALLLQLDGPVAGQQPRSEPVNPSAATAVGDAMISAYLARDAQELDRRFMDGASTADEWRGLRPKLKRELYAMLGLWPIPEKTPLQPRVTGTLERDGNVVVEKLHFQSRPGLYVTANLYRPKQLDGRLPAVLYVCGHSSRGRDGCKTAVQDHGMWYAKNGWICLIVDTLQLGELPGIHHGTARQRRWWWQALGYTPAGVECWNGIRAIDYLTSRADVDPGRIGVTGISGGGAATFWIAAADERVACAVPISGMTDLQSYIEDKVINRHCDCIFMVNTERWPWTTIAALVAPRPLLFANSDADPYFPVDGNRRVIERLRRFYAMAGAPQNVAEYISHGGHADRLDLRQATCKWMNTHLKRDSGPIQITDVPPVAGQQLRVFPEDKDLPGDSQNAAIDEVFVARARYEPPPQDRAAFDSWKRARLAAIRSTSFLLFPAPVPAARAKLSGVADPSLRWLDAEPGILVAVRDLRKPADQSDRCTLVVLNEGESLDGVPPWAQPIVANEAVVVLAPRGVGPTVWTTNDPLSYVRRAHALVGRTVDQGRVWDVMATCGWISGNPAARRRVRLAGKGPAGIVAVYAVLLGAPADDVVVVDPPVSHRDGPIFLEILRTLDIPEALGLLAPAKLTLVRAQGESFAPTRELYDRVGAGAALIIK